MTREEKIAEIQRLVAQNPPSDADIDAALDAVLAELQNPPVAATSEQAVGSVIGAAVIGGLIVHILGR